MNTETLMQLLRGQPFAQGFGAHELEQLGALARQVQFSRDQVLFAENEESSEFYLIVSGTVALEIVPPSGIFRVDTLGAGDELGWSSVMGHGTVFQARALQDVQALAFDAAQLRALCEKDNAFGYQLMRRLLGVVADRLQVTRLHVMDSYWPVARRAGA
jgi:CRP-like cAMP-binding protein